MRERLPLSRSSGPLLPWPALACSVALHAAAGFCWVWPGSPVPEEPAPLLVELMTLAAAGQSEDETNSAAAQPVVPAEPAPAARVPQNSAQSVLRPQPARAPAKPAAAERARSAPGMVTASPDGAAATAASAGAATEPDGETGQVSGPPVHSPAGPAAAEPGPNPSQLADGRALHRWLSGHREYPLSARRRGIEGQVLVRILLAPDGTILDARIEGSSGSALLDRAVLDMIARARESRVPAELKGGGEFVIPVEFKLTA